MKRAVFSVNALVEFAGEKVDTHDSKDEPENQNNKKDIANRWHGLYECVHHNLHDKLKGYTTIY